MKINSNIPPRPSLSKPKESPDRRAVKDGGTPSPQGTAAKSLEGIDRIQISEQATAIRSATEATRLAVETRELIARGNREAVLAQPVDVKRLQELLRTSGTSKEG